ncbi:probable peptidyl-tRNA hydrolase [Ylistrum balloti]|uniref:probable peptidyl-tRNA hydrolase n=1 Tax=Ylistrum balloti TaxID=509963 RepID=UPI002905878C|nr:probable peptidyl-tRNA hydrolase [Ylistrum balloti]
MGSSIRLISYLFKAVTRSNIGRSILSNTEYDIGYEMARGKALKTTSMANNSIGNAEVHKYLIVGLCNHGMPLTRHSVGSRVLDCMATDLDLKWTKDNNCAGFTATFDLNKSAQVIMLKPKQFMNVNGKSVAKTVHHHGIDISKVYIIHDDLDKALSKVTIKEGGSAGGHNGVRSVQNSLKSDTNIFKVRVGIGRPSSRDQVLGYVLNNFSQDEIPGVQEGVRKALQMLTWHLEGRGEDVLLLTKLYGINPKKLQTKTRKVKNTVSSGKRHMGMSTVDITDSGTNVQSDGEQTVTSVTSRSHIKGHDNSFTEKRQDILHRRHSQDGGLYVDTDIVRTKGE